jgi:hypothetical protein
MSNRRRACWPAIAVAGLLIAISCSASTAAFANELYGARAFVTGQVEPGRSQAFARCLGDVLVKVSGDPRLLRDPRLPQIVRNAGTLVTTFSYRDLMAGIPVHDEQGTRDRPYELTVEFDPAKVDATLRTLGREPWLAARPRVVVFLAVRHIATAFLLAGEEARGPGMREALADAAERVGVPLVIPSRAVLDHAALTFQKLQGADPEAVAAAVKAAGGDAALVGKLAWSDKALGWVADWRMAAGTQTERWQVRGVNFDEAFRNGMQGAVQILATGARRD